VSEPAGRSGEASRADLRNRGAGALVALVAAGLGAVSLIAAAFVPVNKGGRAGYVTKIYDRSTTKELQLFALEPVGVGVLVFVALMFVFVSRGTRSWVVGMLLAFGLQSGLLFLAYFGAAVFGNPEFNSLGAGSILGLAGAALLGLAGGTMLFQKRRASAAAA
jgi:hypothetical protein